MREVEVKARVSNPTLVLSKLRDLKVRFGPPITQHDRVFSPASVKEKFGTRQIGVNFLRVRRQGGESFLTLKRSGTNELDSFELETTISDPGQAEKMLEALGYVLASEIKKTRRKSRLKDIEICLDEVEMLGAFIELEKLLEDDGDVSGVQDELFNFLKQLGINDSDRIEQGYDTLMETTLKKRG